MANVVDIFRKHVQANAKEQHKEYRTEGTTEKQRASIVTNSAWQPSAPPLTVMPQGQDLPPPYTAGIASAPPVTIQAKK